MPWITITVAVLITAVASGQHAPDWGERLAGLQGAEWRQAFNVGRQLADLPPDQGYDILAAAWPKIEVKAKQQLLKAFNYAMPYPLHARMHARILDVMHLGVNDHPAVQQWSYNYLKGLALQDFAEDFDAYRAWYAANRARPIRTVMAESCRDYVGRLAEAEPDRQRALASMLPSLWSVFRDTPEVRQAALDAGYLDVIAAWAAHPDTDGPALVDLLSVMGYMEPGEAYLRDVVLAAATNHASLDVRLAAVQALAAIGDPRVIPTVAEPGGEQAVGASRRAAVADIAVQDLLAGGDRHKRYFLIGPHDTDRRPPDGLRLLVVLPGGNGGPDFRPFVENIFTEATPHGYLVAELVAPQWSPDQANQVVWPTEGLPSPQAGFTTEQFIDAVIDDVATRYRLDPRYVLSLSWSSGGPAAYAASLADGSRITGSLVAMSVFKPELLPDLQRARGRRYYILHSPQDFIPMRFAEAARDQLAAGGATTTLVTYEGGHGWHGDVFGTIRRGLEWLQE